MNIEPKVYGGGKQLIIEFMTGLFFLLALAILIFGTVFVKGKNLFGEEHLIKVKFSKIGTLSVSDKVRVIGKELGVVEEIEMGEDFNVLYVTLNMKENIPLFEDYTIAVRNSSVFGGSYVGIIPGGQAGKDGKIPAKLKKYTADGKLVVFDGKPPIDILNEASALIGDLKEDEKKLRKAVFEKKLFENIGDAAKNLSSGVDEFKEFMDKVKSGKGTIAKLINDPDFYDDAKKMVNNINKSSEDLNEVIADVKKGKGTLGKLICDDKAYDELLNSLKDIKKVTGEIAEGKGTIGKLVSDKGKLYDNMNDTLAEAKKITMDLKDGKGTLGKLMTDDELYTDVKETVRQIRAAVEDYREQAPVATFGSMALGAL